MRCAVSGNEGFIGPHLQAALGDDAVLLTDELIEDEMMLAASLASCNALIHLNGHPPDLSLERDDRKVLRLMRGNAKKLFSAVKTHQGLHLILVGSLRVHPQPRNEQEPYYGESHLAPRDITAEGQLWVEERALEHATDTHPVTILRTANVQGVPVDGGEGHGIVHRFCRDAAFGFFKVPGNGEQVKDMIHISDLANIIAGIIDTPPPTREQLAIGTGEGVNMFQLAEHISEVTGSSPEFTKDEEQEVWGVVDTWELRERIEGFNPQMNISGMVQEALENVS